MIGLQRIVENDAQANADESDEVDTGTDAGGDTVDGTES